MHFIFGDLMFFFSITCTTHCRDVDFALLVVQIVLMRWEGLDPICTVPEQKIIIFFVAFISSFPPLSPSPFALCFVLLFINVFPVIAKVISCFDRLSLCITLAHDRRKLGYISEVIKQSGFRIRLKYQNCSRIKVISNTTRYSNRGVCDDLVREGPRI